MIVQRFREYPRLWKKAFVEARKIKTKTGRLVKDIECRLDENDRLETYDEQFWIYARALEQKRDSRDKLDSFFAPYVGCTLKGKEHKKYKFGSKSGFVITINWGIIIGVMSLEGNP